MFTSGNRNVLHGRGTGNQGQGRGNQTVSTPTFYPSSGSYADSVAVTIVCATAGATIHYTTDGSNPTALSPVYASPLTLTTTTTIKAIASKKGYVTSAVGQTTLTVTTSQAAPAPTFSPLPGNYVTEANITISSGVGGASIYYEIGSIGSTPDPTTSSALYTGPVPITSNQTLKAIVVATGYTNSPVTSGNYTRKSAAPSVSPDTGSYVGSTNVTVTNNEPTAIVYYTLDGSDPTSESAQYSAPVLVSGDATFKARAIALDQVASDIVSKTYTILPPTPVVTLSNPNMVWNYGSQRGTLTMDYAVDHKTYPIAYVEFQYSADGINYSTGEFNASDSVSWAQIDVADMNAVPEVFYMRARYVSDTNLPPSVAGDWSTPLVFNTGDYPF